MLWFMELTGYNLYNRLCTPQLFNRRQALMRPSPGRMSEHSLATSPAQAFTTRKSRTVASCAMAEPQAKEEYWNKQIEQSHDTRRCSETSLTIDAAMDCCFLLTRHAGTGGKVRRGWRLCLILHAATANWASTTRFLPPLLAS